MLRRDDRARMRRRGPHARPLLAALILCTAVFAGVGAPADAQETVPLGVTVYDDLDFAWDIDPSGYIDDGSDDAYDGGHELYVNGQWYPGFENATVELDGDQFVIGPAVFGDIEVVRKVFISRDGAFARWIEILNNTSETGQTVTLEVYTNLGSDDYEQFAATSSGDIAFTVDDRWIVTDDSPLGSTGDDPTVVHVLGAPEAALTVARVGDGAGYGGYWYQYDVYVPPLGQAAIMHYGAQRWYGDDGVDIAVNLSNMTTAQGFFGITEAEADIIQNFVVGTDPFIAIVEPGDGVTLGAGAADPSIGADMRVFLANQPPRRTGDGAWWRRTVRSRPPATQEARWARIPPHSSRRRPTPRT